MQKDIKYPNPIFDVKAETLERLEENLEANFAKIRKIVEFVIRECRSEHEVYPMVKKLMTDKVMDAIKEITISDVIGTVLGIVGLIPR